MTEDTAFTMWAEGLTQTGIRELLPAIPTAIAIATRGRPRGFNCFPSQPTLARGLGLALDGRAVREHIRLLIKHGWLREVSRQEGGTVTYEISTPAAQCQTPGTRLPTIKLLDDEDSLSSLEEIKGSSPDWQNSAGVVGETDAYARAAEELADDLHGRRNLTPTERRSYIQALEIALVDYGTDIVRQANIDLAERASFITRKSVSTFIEQAARSKPTGKNVSATTLLSDGPRTTDEFLEGWHTKGST
jgi:hypothetical protein